MKHFGLSEDEIIRDWSLHTEDLAFVRKFRKQYQLWIYLQVCSLKLFDQMLDNPNILDTRWLEQKVLSGMTIPENPTSEAEVFLISNKIALPTLYYLKRYINSFCSQQHEKIFTEIYQQLPESLISEIDQTLEIIPGEGITWFQKVKEYPGASSISLLQDYLQRYHRIESINLSSVDISPVPPELVQHFTSL